MANLIQQTDVNGFLSDATSWTWAWAQQQAQAHSLHLTEDDERIVLSLRDFYFTYDISPAMRVLVKHLKTTVSPEVGNSIWLMQRYGESPARMLALISGLPKPKNCL